LSPNSVQICTSLCWLPLSSCPSKHTNPSTLDLFLSFLLFLMFSVEQGLSKCCHTFLFCLSPRVKIYANMEKLKILESEQNLQRSLPPSSQITAGKASWCCGLLPALAWTNGLPVSSVKPRTCAFSRGGFPWAVLSKLCVQMHTVPDSYYTCTQYEPLVLRHWFPWFSVDLLWHM
jgi:hypothetical protein